MGPYFQGAAFFAPAENARKHIVWIEKKLSSQMPLCGKKTLDNYLIGKNLSLGQRYKQTDGVYLKGK